MDPSLRQERNASPHRVALRQIVALGHSRQPSPLDGQSAEFADICSWTNLRRRTRVSISAARLEPETTGRPGYHPATMLKLYLYGYLNQVQSSRRLERECARNLEHGGALFISHVIIYGAPSLNLKQRTFIQFEPEQRDRA